MGQAKQKKSEAAGVGASKAQGKDQDGLSVDIQPPVRVAMLLDRSTEGRAALKDMLNDEQIPLMVRSELDEWAAGAHPVAILCGDPEGRDWAVHRIADAEVGLSKAIESISSSAISESAILQWTTAVDSRKSEHFRSLIADAAIGAAKKLGISPMDAPQHIEPALYKGLLDLAIAPGGREVDFGRVQVTDPKVFLQVVNFGMQPLVMKLANADRPMDEASPCAARVDHGDDVEEVEPEPEHTVRAWKREDGSLLIREAVAPLREAVAPAGSWRLLTPGEYEAMARESAQKMAGVPPRVFEGIANWMNRSVRTMRESQARMAKLKEAATAIAALFGRNGHSMLVLREMIATYEPAREFVDRWLGSSQPYLLFWRAMDGRVLVLTAASDEQLLSDSLPKLLAAGDGPAATVLSALTGQEIDRLALAWWEKHGGLVMERPTAGH